MTPDARVGEIVNTIVVSIGDRFVRIMTNLGQMHDEAAPNAQIAAYLRLESHQLQHWLEHELEGEVRAALKELDL